MITRSDMREFFQQRPCLRVRCVGEEAGYSEGRAFQNWLNKKGNSEQLPLKMLLILLPVLMKYGYQLDVDGELVQYLIEDDRFFINRGDPNRNLIFRDAAELSMWAGY